MSERILVTSALPYSNGPIHLGHIAGAYLPADIFVRYCRLARKDVLFVCGTDEHGVAIIIRAQQEGKTPQQLVDTYHARIKASFERLGIRFDNFSRTSIPLHHKISRDFFTRLHEKGYVQPKTTEQHFCETCGRFLPDRYIEGECPNCHDHRARGDQCDSCGKWLEPTQIINPKCTVCGSLPVIRTTEHWFLRLGLFQEDLRKWLESKTTWKANVREFCAGLLREGLEDRSITRDLEWGVEVPLKDAAGKVLYVWFDAPIGYLTSTMEWAQSQGRPDAWREYWTDKETRLIHFIGKDNIVFHAIVWPAMLMGQEGYILPSEIPANEFLTIEGEKLSTSRNWAVWLDDYLEAFPPDPLRYYLAVNAPEAKDADFSWKEFQRRNNGELADILGNFVNRTVSFVARYRDNAAPSIQSPDRRDQQTLDAIAATAQIMARHFERFEVRRATREMINLARIGNKYFADKQPWVTRKSNPQACDTTLAVCLRLITALTILMEPILPHSSCQLGSLLNWKAGFSAAGWQSIPTLELPEGHRLGTPSILYPKIEDDAIQDQVEKLLQTKKR